MQLKKLFTQLFCVLIILFVAACANIGIPEGGPYDEQPPKLLYSSPEKNELNYKKNKIELWFDEYIQLDNPGENIIVTPPQLELPKIQAVGKKLLIELLDTLKDSTTYTIDFTNSIVDNNERNVLENFSIAFSTGDEIDSLAVSGYLLNAENLEPMTGIYIGLHKDLSDTAFYTLPFDRITKTNDRGMFTLRNIASGNYHIFALDDKNRNYQYDGNEAFAFVDSLIIPNFEFAERQDTTWVDSTKIDTIRTIKYTKFLPDNLCLRLSSNIKERQYLVKCERPDTLYFDLEYGAVIDSLPQLNLLNAEADSAWLLFQYENPKKLRCWITDSLYYKMDTMQMELSHFITDTLDQLIFTKDTLTITLPKHKRSKSEKNKDKDQKEEAPKFFAELLTKQGTIVPDDSVSISFSQPLVDIDTSLIKLEYAVDTLWKSSPFLLEKDERDPLRFLIKSNFKYGEKYRISIDSAQFFSLYNLPIQAFSDQISVQKLEELGSLDILVNGVDTTAYVDLLNGSDKMEMRSPVINGKAEFKDIKPNKYYIRLVEDWNNNGLWDSGDYFNKKQPEPTYYCSKVIDIRANWKLEEEWSPKEGLLNKQKPLEITKNKPKEKVKKRRNEDRKDRKKQNGMGSFGGGSLLPGGFQEAPGRR